MARTINDDHAAFTFKTTRHSYFLLDCLPSYFLQRPSYSQCHPLLFDVRKTTYFYLLPTHIVLIVADIVGAYMPESKTIATHMSVFTFACTFQYSHTYDDGI